MLSLPLAVVALVAQLAGFEKPAWRLWDLGE